jgi:hypothetical protein
MIPSEQWRPAAAGCDEQTRKHAAALSVVRSADARSQAGSELKRFSGWKLVQKRLGKARVAAARKLGIRLWIMMRDQIDYQEFWRRGKARQENGSVCAGMPDITSGPAEA